VTTDPVPIAASSPDDALRRLLEGNRRYASDRMEHPRQGVPRRDEVAAAQHPFAALLGCSDSRVPAEIVFDQGLGDIFVVRSAGPVLDHAILGSLEYAVEHYAMPVLLVLVHERCGAAGAAISARQGRLHAPGRLAYLTEAIAPAVDEAALRPGDLLENTLRAHTARLVDALRRRPPVLAPAVTAGRLRVVGARYDLDSGLVEVIVP
jgi:carbonic anhydrase